MAVMTTSVMVVTVTPHIFSVTILDPTAPDPYEAKMVEVKESEIPGAREGLFARVDIETGTTVAFYNGSRADPAEFNPDSWETNNYR